MSQDFAAEMEGRIMSMGNAYDDFAKAEGIPARLFDIICVLWENPAGISQKAIAEQTWLPKQTVSAKVLALIEDGIAKLSKNPADGRSNLVSLTVKGTQHFQPVMDRLALCEQAATHALTQQERELLLSATARWAQAFNDAAAAQHEPAKQG